jgi:2-hydroxy-3-oxopropionate reductase
MKIGFIGLGLMGRPMALNLIKGGHTLTAWARRPASLEPLLAAGATAADTPAALAAGVDLVVTMVADGPDVEQLMLGPDGVGAGGKAGLVAVDMSTIQPSTAMRVNAELAKKGIAFLDAPVSGGDVGATNGTLSIMVGGTPEAFAKAKPAFECMGKNIVHVGASGAGQVTKAANNMVVALTVTAISEAFCLARKSGVDPARVREALLGGFANSKILDLHGQRLLDRNFRPGFKTWMHQKDLHIALRSAHEKNLALPATALAAQLYNAAVAQGYGDDDTTSVYRVLENLSRLA